VFGDAVGGGAATEMVEVAPCQGRDAFVRRVEWATIKQVQLLRHSGPLPQVETVWLRTANA
jgi:hypothetical protein